jgi:hypothetical protein
VVTAQATEHMQIPLLVYLIKEGIIHSPSSRQARQVCHAIVATRGGNQLPLPDRLANLLIFNYVSSDPRRRSQGATDKLRSVASTDDIVIGATMLSVLLQAAGEPTFDTSARRRCAQKAIELASSLKTWKQRGLDGSGVDATSLTQEETGWAYLATVDCTAALKSPSVLETLEAVFLSNMKATLTKQGPPVWVLRGPGARANKIWATYLTKMKQWIEDATLIFEAR